MCEILAIIPARSGSKSVPNKNIREICGKPMLAYSIEHALSSKYINRVILSTDSLEYKKIGLKYGAEVPFLRPSEYATDDATDFDVFNHALSYLKEKEGYIPDIVVQLRPTYPIRNVDDIDNMIKILINNLDIDSVRSVSKSKEIPYKMWTINSEGKMLPICKDIPECFNMPRQKLPQAYYQNANVDVIRTTTITEKKSMSGTNIYGYVMNHNFDIDTEYDFKRASEYLLIKNGKQKFCFDIDGVIAKTNDTNHYDKSLPNNEVIDLINKLYDYGNQITLFTARGYVTGIDWSDVTKKQMDEWNVKYHQLKFGKPNANYYVDDHAMTLTQLNSLKEILFDKQRGGIYEI